MKTVDIVTTATVTLYELRQRKNLAFAKATVCLLLLIAGGKLSAMTGEFNWLDMLGIWIFGMWYGENVYIWSAARKLIRQACEELHESD